MKELSLHILDLAENSLKAKSKLIEITIEEDLQKDILTIIIEDDGKGMDSEMLRKVEDPFTTTRTTRKVGLGISLTKAACERCNGNFSINSLKGRGTKIICTFQHSHIDRAPLGNMGETMVSIINSTNNTDIVYKHTVNKEKFLLETKEIKKILEGVSIKSVDVLLWIKEYVNEGITNLYKHKKNL
ncbi:ATP-binding protein [Dethiothermospora halolimnae]|uniref:ATP-binding protein n=1 Tax=Dethiothermospora halolimnae TaxID=3114390 RepID=UPI003CCB773C